MKDKKGIASIWLIAIVGLVIVGISFGWFSGIGDALSATPSDDTVAPVGYVPDVEDTTVTFKSFDIENKGTGTGEVHTIWVNDQYFGTVADGGTATLSPFDKIMVLFGNNSESVSGFYPEMIKFDVPNRGTFVATGFQKDKNSTVVSATYLNSDDESLNAAGDAQAVSSGGEETGILKLQASSEDFYGDEYVIVVLEGTQTVYEDIIIEGASEATIPAKHSEASGNKAFAYKVANMVGSKRTSYDVTVKAKDGQDPTTAHNLTVTLYDSSLYVDAETNLVVRGVEDELDGAVGELDHTATIYIS